MFASFKRHFWVALTLTLLSCLVACSTGNQGVTPAPERTSSEAFSVSALDGTGSYTPELNIIEDASGVTAVVSATGASGLSGAAFHLNYDTSRYTPAFVEFGEFLGVEGEVLTIALTDRADYVPVGIAQIGSARLAPASGDGELARVRFISEPFNGRRISTAPLGESNEVTDLAVIGQGAGTVDLHWTEVNAGDYDNNGFVLASDLVPLGFFYGQYVDASSDPERVAMADGNGNGLIEISDITPIGQNYEHSVSGYMIYDNADGDSALTAGLTMSRATAQGHAENSNPNHPVKYTYTAEVPAGFVQFTVRPVDKTDLGNPGVVSNAVTPVSDEDPPVEPSNLVATSGPTVGDQAVQLNWSPSPSLDVRDYVIESQMDSLPGLWEPVATVGSSVTGFLHESLIFMEEPYTYRIHAVDYTDRLSGYAISAPVTPWFFFLPAPVNAVADNDIGTGEAIEVSWDGPADDSDVAFYRVYNADDGILLKTTSSKLITTYLNTGLTPGVTYNYYVKSVSIGGMESVASNTASNTPSEITEINITSLTTDKTTHHTGGAETASNLSVVTDVPADSVDWVCSQGAVTGTGQDVTWSPPGGATADKVTITCTVHAGPASDTRDIFLYLTTAPIKTSMGQDGGHFIDFDTPGANDDLLECVAWGAGRVDNRPFSWFADGDHVLIFDRWESG